jgi:RNA polymerase sigma-70 factor (sigma-E family)
VGGNHVPVCGLLIDVKELAEQPPAWSDLVSVLYSQHREALFRLAYGLVGDRAEAEELVQDAFAGLMRRWSSLRDLQAAPAYLRTAVVNGAKARWRKRRVRDLARPGPRPSVHRDRDVAEQSAMLQAIGQLPLRKRACVLLRYYGDLTEAETAQVLGVSVGTVKSQTAKALQQLALILEDSESGSHDR